MEILEPNDETTVQYYNSTLQHRNKLSVYRGGQWVPIAFDSLDYISCKDGVVSHRACVTDGDDIGFNFPVDKMSYTSDTYVTHDHDGVELKALPEWFGTGYYKEAVKTNAFISTDINSLGVRNTYEMAVGLDYALADNTLESADVL